MNSLSDLLESSLWGIARGYAVQPFTFPLEAIKANQQLSSPPQNALTITKQLYHEGGIPRFYRGLSSELTKISIKQFWCWPMITGLPRFLAPYRLNDLTIQLITGLSISTTHAIIATPLETRKITSISTGKTTTPFYKIDKEGWKGFSVYWSKISVSWVSFLTAQQYLRSRAKRSTEAPLNMTQLMVIGTQTAAFVSIISAPFDLATTLRLAKKQPLLTHPFRGLPLNALSLVIQNIASIALIDWLDVQ